MLHVALWAIGAAAQPCQHTLLYVALGDEQRAVQCTGQGFGFAARGTNPIPEQEHRGTTNKTH